MAPIKGRNTARALRGLFDQRNSLVPMRETSLNPRNLERNFEQLQTWLGVFGKPTEDIQGNTGHSALELLARILGGQLIIGVVATSAATDDTGDTEFEHGLGRIPRLVILSWDPDSSQPGTVLGARAGGMTAAGANFTPWTRDRVYVRSTYTDTHAFIVV